MHMLFCYMSLRYQWYAWMRWGPKKAIANKISKHTNNDKMIQITINSSSQKGGKPINPWKKNQQDYKTSSSSFKQFSKWPAEFGVHCNTQLQINNYLVYRSKSTFTKLVSWVEIFGSRDQSFKWKLLLFPCSNSLHVLLSESLWAVKWHIKKSSSKIINGLYT